MTLEPGGTTHHLARIGRHPQFRVDAGDRHLGRSDLRTGEDAVGGNAVGIRLERGPFVDGLGFGHDSIGLDLAVFGYIGFHNDEVVELEILIVLQHNTELARRRVLGPQDPSDSVFRHSFACHEPSSAAAIMALTSAVAWLLRAAPGR